MAKSSLAAGVLVAAIGSFGYFSSGTSLWIPHQSGDIIEETQKTQRQNEFAALGTLVVDSISEADIVSAVDSMGLPQTSQDALLASLKEQASSAISQPTPSPATLTQEKTAMAKIAESSPAHLAKKSPPLRLTWITFWDTDAEDGDAIRIDTQGYSRTVSLTKEPITLAIPIPAEGSISVVGIRDGEGGGITVGLASGESRAVFPIMSVGQTLGLKVRVR